MRHMSSYDNLTFRMLSKYPVDPTRYQPTWFAMSSDKLRNCFTETWAHSIGDNLSVTHDGLQKAGHAYGGPCPSIPCGVVA